MAQQTHGATQQSSHVLLLVRAIVLLRHCDDFDGELPGHDNADKNNGPVRRQLILVLRRGSLALPGRIDWHQDSPRLQRLPKQPCQDHRPHRRPDVRPRIHRRFARYLHLDQQRLDRDTKVEWICCKWLGEDGVQES